jgi:hypothetical protein
MTHTGVRAAMQESDRVAEKGRKRKRILEAVKEVGQAKAQEQGQQGSGSGSRCVRACVGWVVWVGRGWGWTCLNHFT